ncbi:MAG: lipocalin-like domain-containing protein [Xanthomonadaceae bacterium]|nr:lipocalin-like domain-containing protein [Xanthomonadaceae bacterium]
MSSVIDRPAVESAGPCTPETEDRSEILGVWRVVSCIVTTESGERIEVYGDSPSGALIYLPNGYMSVHVIDTQRPGFAHNDFLRGTNDEVRRAFEGCLSYFGSFEYRPREGLVRHYPIHALHPNWSGTCHVRYTRIDGDNLHIHTPPIPFRGQPSVMRLLWQRSTLPETPADVHPAHIDHRLLRCHSPAGRTDNAHSGSLRAGTPDPKQTRSSK